MISDNSHIVKKSLIFQRRLGKKFTKMVWRKKSAWEWFCEISILCTVHFDEIFCFKKVEIQKFREIYYIILLFLTNHASRNKILYPERNHSFHSCFRTLEFIVRCTGSATQFLRKRRFSITQPFIVIHPDRRSRAFYVKMRRFLVLQFPQQIANVCSNIWSLYSFRIQKLNFHIWL